MFPIHQGNRDHHYGLTLKGFQYFRSVSLKKYLHSTTSDSGIISHQTATKRDYLLEIFPETIMIIGQWSSNSFLWYIRIQVSDHSKGIIDLMVSNKALYTIPEAKGIYYTLGQPGVQFHILKPHWGIKINTTFSLVLPLINGPQGRDTQTTLSEISEQQHGKMVQFFKP